MHTRVTKHKSNGIRHLCLFLIGLPSRHPLRFCFTLAHIQAQTSITGQMNLSIHGLLFIKELIINLVVFVLFASAYPDRYRTALWFAGGTHEWNSNPALHIYCYANHKESPEILWIWRQRSAPEL